MADKKPSPVQVGNKFIQKYYERLSQQPDMVWKFYQVRLAVSLLLIRITER